MQKFIKIESVGIIDPQAFTLVGASTKRDDQTKIGFFGSGLKYSIAFLLRNNVKFKVFAEYKEILFDVEPVSFREKDFSIIVINGQKTSLTTDMGADWESWFIIREIYCNAIDEGDSSISIVKENECLPVENKTVFYIEITSAIQEVVDKWDEYFSADRKDLFYEDKTGCKIYPGADTLIVYRKGIRCQYSPSAKAIFHYDMPWVSINESRVIKSDWDFQYNLRDFLQKIKEPKVIRQLLNRINDSWESQLNWNNNTSNFTDAWAEVIGSKSLVPVENAGFWEEYIRKQPDLYLIIPGVLIQGLKTKFPDSIRVIGDLDGVKGTGDFRPCGELSKRNQCLLDDSLEWLRNADYKVTFPIKVVEFSRATVFGQAKDDTILLSEKLFELGKRKIAAVIIEEQEHLVTNFNDETRQFQDHFINKYVSALEDKTGKFL